jgi:hypothetical protein
MISGGFCIVGRALVRVRVLRAPLRRDSDIFAFFGCCALPDISGRTGTSCAARSLYTEKEGGGQG